MRRISIDRDHWGRHVAVNLDTGERVFLSRHHAGDWVSSHTGRALFEHPWDAAIAAFDALEASS